MIINLRFSIALLSTACAAVLALSAHAKGTGYLFVSSEKDNVVMVLDGKSYAVVKQIRTAARPRHLQFNPDRTLIYAACGDGNAIDIIDVAKLELIDRIAEINDPELFDLSPDGKIMYISLEDAAMLGILKLEEYFAARGEKPELTVAEATTVDAEEGEVEEEGAEEGSVLPGMTTVEVGAEPEGILVNPAGKIVYVTSEVANMVHVVNVESREVTANIMVGSRPRRFALTPDQKELWVSNELSGSVTILDAAANKIITTIEFKPKGFRPEDITPVGITMTDDGKTAFVALGRANHVAVVDVAKRKIEDFILVGKRAWNAMLNRNNSLLFVANGLSDDVSIIDVAKRKVIKSIPVMRVPHTILIDD